MGAKAIVIRVIGDSHVKSFWQHPLCLLHHIGPITAHNLSDEDSSTNGRRLLFSLAERLIDDPLLLVFGEIDCRNHFCRIIENEKTVSGKVVSRTIQNYLSVAKELIEKGNTIILHSGIPASRKGSIAYNFCGTEKQRIRISQLFHKLLIENCKKEEIPFVDIFGELQDRSGLLKKSLTIDGVHMLPNERIFEIITKQITKILDEKVEEK